MLKIPMMVDTRLKEEDLIATIMGIARIMYLTKIELNAVSLDLALERPRVIEMETPIKTKLIILKQTPVKSPLLISTL
jgi:hypothetical protein